MEALENRQFRGSTGNCLDSSGSPYLRINQINDLEAQAVEPC
jgi:hypothetical protein